MRFLLSILLSFLISLSILSAQSERPESIVIPVSSLGDVSETRKKILQNTLEDELKENFMLISQERFEEAQEKAFEELDYEECTEDQCIMMIQEMLQVENVFHLEVIGERSDTQLSLSWRSLDEKKKETDFCEGCMTKELNEKVNGLVKKLIGVQKEVVVIKDKIKKVQLNVVKNKKRISNLVTRNKEFQNCVEYINQDNQLLFGRLIHEKNSSRTFTEWYKYGNEKIHQKYIGETKNCLPDGKGTHTFPNGDKYIGEFRKGKKHGQGTIYWSNGNKVVGEFQYNEYFNVTIYDSDGNEIGRIQN